MIVQYSKYLGALIAIEKPGRGSAIASPRARDVSAGVAPGSRRHTSRFRHAVAINISVVVVAGFITTHEPLSWAGNLTKLLTLTLECIAHRKQDIAGVHFAPWGITQYRPNGRRYEVRFDPMVCYEPLGVAPGQSHAVPAFFQHILCEITSSESYLRIGVPLIS